MFNANERPEDIEKQKIVAKKYCDFTHEPLTYVTTPKFCGIDVLFLKYEHLFGLAEIKVRKESVMKWNGVYLDVDKWLTIRHWERVLVPEWGAFIVSFPEGIYFFQPGKYDIKRFRVQMVGGNTNGGRSTLNDRRPAVIIPLERFDRICDSSGLYEGN